MKKQIWILMFLLNAALVSAAAPQVQLMSARANGTLTSLHVEGQNFCDDAAVKLNGSPLAISNLTATSLDAALPVGIAPGSYLLSVFCGTGTVQNTDFEVTIGAAGPQGIQGPQGPQGVQGPQGIQGPPGPSSVPAPVNVLDRNSIVVGELANNGNTGLTGTNGLTSALLRYRLPQGDSIFLNVSQTGLGSIFNPISALVLFKQGDCSGDAYVFRTFLGQLSRRQAITLVGLSFGPPQTPACPLAPSSDWLYLSDTFACPIFNDINNPTFTLADFQSFYDGLQPGGCSPVSQLPSFQATFLQSFVWILHRTEDLAQKFTLPFYIP